jgi:hypothetical protein
LRRKAEDAHCLEVPAGTTVWTLVLVTKKKRAWGFHTRDGWKSHVDYLNEKYGAGNWEEEPEAKRR